MHDLPRPIASKLASPLLPLLLGATLVACAQAEGDGFTVASDVGAPDDSTIAHDSAPTETDATPESGASLLDSSSPDAAINDTATIDSAIADTATTTDSAIATDSAIDSGNDEDAGPDASPIGAGSWRAMASPPAGFGPRALYAGVWSTTTNEALFWGGVMNAATTEILPLDGAAYSPARDAWTKIASGPLTQGRTLMAFAWTGTAMIVWGGQGPGSTNLGDGSLYDPKAKTWTMLPSAPIAARYNTSFIFAPTTNEFLIWGGETYDSNKPPYFTRFADGVAFNVKTQTWRLLAPSPLSAREDALAAWDGARMIVAGGGEYETDAAAYDPSTNNWSMIAIPANAFGTTYGCVAENATFYGGFAPSTDWVGSGARYDESLGWATMGGPTLVPASRMQPNCFASSDAFYMWGGRGDVTGSDGVWAFASGGAIYSYASKTWSKMADGGPLMQGPPVVWTGTEAIFWSGDRPTPTAEGQIFTP